MAEPAVRETPRSAARRGNAGGASARRRLHPGARSSCGGKPRSADPEAGFESPCAAPARCSLGSEMKLAIAGKGGSGKTSISGTMARLLARRGVRVLAIDGDSNPNLALTLGVPAEQWGSVPTLPRDLARRGENGIELSKSVDEVRASHSIQGPDGTTLLVMAHP